MVELSSLWLCRSRSQTGSLCWRCCGMTSWCATPPGLCSAGPCGGPSPPAAIFKWSTTPRACGSRWCLLAMLLSITEAWRPFPPCWVSSQEGDSSDSHQPIRFSLLSQTWTNSKEWFTYFELWYYNLCIFSQSLQNSWDSCNCHSILQLKP